VIRALDAGGRVTGEATLAFPDAPGRRRARLVCEADPAALARAYSEAAAAGDCPLVCARPVSAPGELPGPGHLLCTSGTTGPTPRLYYFTREAALGNARAHVASLGLDAGDRVLLTMSMSHSFGLVAAGLGCALLGAPLLAFASTPDPATLLAAIAEHEVTTVYLTPPLARLLLRHARRRPPPRLPSLRRLSVGSAPMTRAELAELSRAFAPARVIFTYGLTELGPRVATLSDAHDKSPPTPAAAGGVGSAAATSDAHDKSPPTPAAAGGALAPIGRPIDGVELALRDGELFVRSRWASAGRLVDGHLVPLAGADGFVATRDAARATPDGIELLGRLDGVIVTGGANVYPEDVERVADSVDGVAASCLIARASPLYGQVPVLVCEPTPGADPAAAVLARLRAELPASHLPVDILLRPLPRTAAGKVARAAVRAELA
jgi:acyl-CoA synthetase (AMP-forming)/AMP-acid ligase II